MTQSGSTNVTNADKAQIRLSDANIINVNKYTNWQLMIDDQYYGDILYNHFLLPSHVEYLPIIDDKLPDFLLSNKLIDGMTSNRTQSIQIEMLSNTNIINLNQDSEVRNESKQYEQNNVSLSINNTKADTNNGEIETQPTEQTNTVEQPSVTINNTNKEVKSTTEPSGSTVATKPTVPELTENIQTPVETTPEQKTEATEATEITESMEQEETVPSTKPIETPAKCVEHDFILSETTIVTQFELYNYVTDTYCCLNCGYSKKESHIASNHITQTQIAEVELNLLNLINQLRAENNLNQLTTNQYWNDWANTRAKELCSFYGHGRPDGSSWTHTDGTNYTLAENIAVGNSSSNEFFMAFYESSSHYGAMINPYATMIGVGIYVDENGTTHCAVVFIAPY